MKKIFSLISSLMLVVFLSVAANAQTSDVANQQPQQKASNGKAKAKKSNTRKSSKREQGKAAVDKETKKRHALIQSESSGKASK